MEKRSSSLNWSSLRHATRKRKTKALQAFTLLRLLSVLLILRGSKGRRPLKMQARGDPRRKSTQSWLTGSLGLEPEGVPAWVDWSRSGFRYSSKSGTPERRSSRLRQDWYRDTTELPLERGGGGWSTKVGEMGILVFSFLLRGEGKWIDMGSLLGYTDRPKGPRLENGKNGKNRLVLVCENGMVGDGEGRWANVDGNWSCVVVDEQGTKERWMSEREKKEKEKRRQGIVRERGKEGRTRGERRERERRVRSDRERETCERGAKESAAHNTLKIRIDHQWTYGVLGRGRGADKKT